MADPVSIASVAVGFVGFVLQVATTSANFVQDAKGFPEEFTKLDSETQEFRSLVQKSEPAINIVQSRYGNETHGINLALTHLIRSASAQDLGKVSRSIDRNSNSFGLWKKEVLEGPTWLGIYEEAKGPRIGK